MRAVLHRRVLPEKPVVKTGGLLHRRVLSKEHVKNTGGLQNASSGFVLSGFDYMVCNQLHGL